MGGFYGNITNSVKTNMTFARKYSSRYQMEQNMQSDAVMSGNYVLIEYGLSWDDTIISNDVFVMLYYVNGVYSTSPDGKIDLKVTTGQIYRKVALESWVQDYQGKDLTHYYTNEYLIGREGGFLEPVIDEEDDYTKNYNIDKAAYVNIGRGWDSTVWQKTYDVLGQAKYVMVAELNSVVPTFNVSVDAPTEIPLSPHFDEAGTNIMYNLHMQPSWGIRIKEYNQSESDYLNDDNFKTSRTFYTYDTNNKVINAETKTKEVPLDVYFNRAGFDSEKSKEVSLNNEIKLTPTGISGKYYNDPNHGPTASLVAQQADILELSFILPELGNTISKMWDIFYEKNTTHRYKDIAWKSASEKGSSLLDLDLENHINTNINGGMTRNLETFAGCINSIHDLMGMIIYGKNERNLNTTAPTEADVNYIFEYLNNFYYVYKYGKLIPVDESTDKNKDWYILKSNEITDNFTIPNLVYYNNAKGYNKDLSLYYFSDTEFEYKYIPFISFKQQLNTIYGCILKMTQMLNYQNPNSRNKDTVQGAINCLNDIIGNFKQLLPDRFVTINKDGAFLTVETKTDNWIDVNIDTDNNNVNFTHKNPYPEGLSSFGLTNDLTIENNYDSFVIPQLQIDKKGHIYNGKNYTVNVPKVFTTIDFNGSKNIASTLNDTLTVNTDKTWIISTSDINNKTININHGNPSNENIVSEAEVEKLLLSEYNENNLTNYKFSVITRDSKGHILSNSYKAIVPANGFSKIVPIQNQNLFTYKEIQLNLYQKDTYYYQDDDGNFVLDQNDKITLGRDYFNSEYNIIKLNLYEYKKYYSLNENNEYVLDDYGELREITYFERFLSDYSLTFDNKQILSQKPIDEFSIINKDPWITINSLSSDNQIILGHSKQDSLTLNTIGEDNYILKFGGEILYPVLTVDEAGHISNAKNSTLILPSFNKNIIGEGDIITDLILTNDGNYNITKNNLNNLKLNNFNGITAPESITNDSTIGEILKYLNDNSIYKNNEIVLDDNNKGTLETLLKDLLNRIIALENK